MTDTTQSWRPPKAIRPLAIGLIRREGEILVMAVKDDRGGIKGWRPPGGGIEFGESAEQTVVRELMEELGESAVCRDRVCVLENIFVHEGHPGHEVVFVFDVEFSEPSAYANERYAYVDQGISNEVVWRSVREFSAGTETLFPEGLLEHL